MLTPLTSSSLKLTIYKESSENFTLLEHNICFNIKKIDIENEKNEHWNSFDQPLRTLAKDIHIYIQTNEVVKEVKLPKEINSALAKIISEGKPTTDFNCLDFINFVWGKYFSSKPHTIIVREWIFNSIQSEEDMEIGDCICLTAEENRNLNDFRHFSIYLGDGLHISVFGKLQLFVTDFEQMRNSYPTKGILVLKPKKYSFDKNFLSIFKECLALQKAEAFFERKKKKNKLKTVTLNDLDIRSEKTILNQLLNEYSGICIAEMPNNQEYARKFCIENMGFLKDKGVKNLFLEYFPYDERQYELDFFMSNGQFSPALNHDLNEDPLPNSTASYRNMLIKARELGIRVIGIDAQVARTFSITIAPAKLLETRDKIFNHIASKIIKTSIADNRGKSVAIIGAFHADIFSSKTRNIPSLSELIGWPSIWVTHSDSDQIAKDATISLQGRSESYTLYFHAGIEKKS